MMRLILQNRHKGRSVNVFIGEPTHGARFTFYGSSRSNDVARAAVWYVRRQVEYWGIDPKTEGYCTKCRQKKPLGQFPILSRCQSCVNLR
jgi:hypothetical protein